jgi:sugar lactone lactonase YvrE
LVSSASGIDGVSVGGCKLITNAENEEGGVIMKLLLPNSVRIGLLSLVFVLLLGFVPHAFSFSNGQAASLVIGQSRFTTSTHATTANGLDNPLVAAFDKSGNLWVVDYVNNRVLEYTHPLSTGMSASLVIGQPNFTTGTAALTASGLYRPAGAAFDSSGNLWVVDSSNNRVLEYTPPFFTGMSASLVIGQSSFTALTPALTARGLDNPSGLAFDPSGNLWVADEGNNRVLEYTPAFSTGMNASLVIGQPNLTTGTAALSASGLYYPYYLAFDNKSGNLWVADTDNNRVLEYTHPFSTGKSASLVIGQPDFTTGTPALTASGLDFPSGLAFDPSGNLWVADEGNNRVLEYTHSLSSGMSAQLVIGQSKFTTSAAATTASGLYNPYGLTFDKSRNLWVVDYNNNRVLEYSGPSITATITMTITTTVTQPVTTSVTSTRTVTNTRTATDTQTVTGPGATVTDTQTVTEPGATVTDTQTVTNTQTVTGPGATVTATQTTTSTTTQNSSSVPTWAYATMVVLLIVGPTVGYIIRRPSVRKP